MCIINNLIHALQNLQKNTLGLEYQTGTLASFPGPTQLSIACSTESDGKLGGAWEPGYWHPTNQKGQNCNLNEQCVSFYEAVSAWMLLACLRIYNACGFTMLADLQCMHGVKVGEVS